MYIQSIRTNILTIFLTILGIVSLALLISQYYFNYKLAESSTDRTFALITSNLTQHLKRSNTQIENILKSELKNKNISKPISLEEPNKAINDLIQVLSTYEGIHSIYFAHKDGSMFQMVNMKNNKNLYTLYKAPKETFWTNIIRVNNSVKCIFLDQNRNEISSYKVEKRYNPLRRVWYKKAIQNQGFAMTEPYIFTNLNKYGITYATELEQKGTVLAID